MADKWVTMAEACHILNISQRTLHRRIKQEEIQSKLEHGRRLVLMDGSHEADDMSQLTDMADVADVAVTKALLENTQHENELLKEQLQEKDKQIENLQGQLERANEALAEASHRHDTVVMQMTRLLEYHQQPFWRKLFSRKALPPPEQIMDMEKGDDNSL